MWLLCLCICDRGISILAQENCFLFPTAVVHTLVTFTGWFSIGDNGNPRSDAIGWQRRKIGWQNIERQLSSMEFS